MGKRNRRKTDSSNLISIGFKLVTIVTFIVLMSLGSITALVSWLVRQDLQILAEETNFEVNRRSSTEAEDDLAQIRSSALMLIHTGQNNADYFFAMNPRMAAVFHAVPNQKQDLYINEHFFLSHDIDVSLVRVFLDSRENSLRQASAGETLILNAAPQFTTHLLAMFFPGETGGAGVLFSPDSLNASFGSGTNQSWMINSSGDILVHADFEHVKNGENVSEYDFIRDIQVSPYRSRQALVDTNFGFGGNSGTTQRAYIIQRAVQIWEIVKQKTIDVYNFCADFIFDSFRMERNTVVTQQKREEIETVRQFVAYTKLNIGGCTVITNIEYDKVFEGIAATTRRNIYLTLAVLGFSIMLIWFFAKSISTPLKILAAAARTIEGGTFEVRLPVQSRDEIGVLTSSFRKMCSALGIFGKFTNRDIALQAMRGQIKPGGLPKHATIFFSDIRGFTEKSEIFTNVFGEDASNKIIYWLNEYFTEMIDCVGKTNGIIDKFIGDAVMAHWGTASTSGSPAQDAYNCVLSALMMRKALYKMNKQRRKGDPGNPSICIGAGINTGIVTAGQLGSDMRMEYTVIGDPVNLASRIESLNKPLGTDILISEDTWNLVNKHFITEEMPSVTVKGKEKPVRIFAVIGAAGTRNGPKTLAEVRNLLGIKEPNLEGVDVNAGENKYKIGSKKNQK